LVYLLKKVFLSSLPPFLTPASEYRELASFCGGGMELKGSKL